MILIDARAVTNKPCGVSRVAQSLVSHLADANEPCGKVTLLVNEDYRKLVPIGLEVITVPRHYGRLSIIDNFYLFFLLRKLKPRVFYSLHSWLPLFLPNSIAKRGFLLHDLFAIRSKEHFKGSWIKKHLSNLFFRFIGWVSLKNATFVVVPSNTIRRDVLEYYGDSGIPVHQIYHGLEHLGNDGSCGADDSAALARTGLLFIGNFREYKGIDILLSALNILQENGRVVRTTIVTNESIKRIAELRDSLRLEDCSIIASPTDAELREIRLSHEIAVIPSREEGFGLPVAEALFSGLYPVYSDIDVFRELYGEYRLGSTFRSCDPESLSNVLAVVMDQLSQNKVNLAENASIRTLILDKYSWDNAASETRVLFQ